VKPLIQYLTTSDDVTIAYCISGDGPVLLLVGVMYSHLLEELNIPRLRALYDRIAHVARLVRYDPRGFGLSERNITDFSLEAMVNDIEAVIDHLDLKDIQLVAAPYGLPTPLATAIVARRPDRFTHLVLPAAFESAPAMLVDQVNALLDTPSADWRFVSESLSRLAQGWDDAEDSSNMAALLRQSIDMEQFRRFWVAAKTWTAAPFLARVRVPTLVISYKDHRFAGEAQGRKLVAGITGGRLSLVDASTGEGRGLQIATVTAAFLGGAFLSEAGPDEPTPVDRSGTAVILFADIADSTALTERLGDAAFRTKARELGPALRALVRECGGTPVEGPTLGDGVLAVFTSAREAVGAALRCATAGTDAGLPLHLGLHAGDVSREKDPDGRDNVYGGAVNIAARISGLSAAGEVLVSETVRSLARTSASVQFEDRGEQALKGVGEPVRVWAVVESGS
jgi:class 3 adenylate cyclase/pimeloyl-ACP methyl ester carboxylesterase